MIYSDEKINVYLPHEFSRLNDEIIFLSIEKEDSDIDYYVYDCNNKNFDVIKNIMAFLIKNNIASIKKATNNEKEYYLKKIDEELKLFPSDGNYILFKDAMSKKERLLK